MRKEVLVLFLVLILFLSSLAYNYAIFFNYNKRVEIPKEKILNKISEEERNLALQYGYTLIYYNYSNEYDEIKNYLESLTYDKAIILILNRGEEKIIVESLKGNRELYKPSLNETFNLVCEIAIDSPLDCLLREIE